MGKRYSNPQTWIIWQLTLCQCPPKGSHVCWTASGSCRVVLSAACYQRCSWGFAIYIKILRGISTSLPWMDEWGWMKDEHQSPPFQESDQQLSQTFWTCLAFSMLVKRAVLIWITHQRKPSANMQEPWEMVSHAPDDTNRSKSSSKQRTQLFTLEDTKVWTRAKRTCLKYRSDPPFPQFATLGFSGCRLASISPGRGDLSYTLQSSAPRHLQVFNFLIFSF